jgi:2-polyprenyl-6-methoxyphenol hydroxylase-like FAD-dependent oxidoreductase
MSRCAIVIGAGLAGSSAAERLAARGWTIALIEQAPTRPARAPPAISPASCGPCPRSTTTAWRG